MLKLFAGWRVVLGITTMNSIRITQKILNTLTGFAGLGLVAAGVGSLLNFQALPLFAFASGALVLLIAAQDYAPRASAAGCDGATGATMPGVERSFRSRARGPASAARN